MIGAATAVAAAVLGGQRRNPTEEVRRRIDKEFSAQMSALRRQNCPKAVVKTLERKRPQVIARTVGMTFLGNRRIFFSPVIPAPQLSIPEQMLMVRNGVIPGRTFLGSRDITDEMETPQEPYFIFNIDNGAKTLGWTPQQAEQAFSRQPRRRGLNCVEAIGLCCVSDVLSRFNIDAIASRVKGRLIPFLWVVDREPRLGADKDNASDPKWGIPSCNTVVM